MIFLACIVLFDLGLQDGVLPCVFIRHLVKSVHFAIVSFLTQVGKFLLFLFKLGSALPLIGHREIFVEAFAF